MSFFETVVTGPNCCKNLSRRRKVASTKSGFVLFRGLDDLGHGHGRVVSILGLQGEVCGDFNVQLINGFENKGLIPEFGPWCLTCSAEICGSEELEKCREAT